MLSTKIGGEDSPLKTPIIEDAIDKSVSLILAEGREDKHKPDYHEQTPTPQKDDWPVRPSFTYSGNTGSYEKSYPHHLDFSVELPAIHLSNLANLTNSLVLMQPSHKPEPKTTSGAQNSFEFLPEWFYQEKQRVLGHKIQL